VVLKYKMLEEKEGRRKERSKRKEQMGTLNYVKVDKKIPRHSP
jgi:hypothetical protein